MSINNLDFEDKPKQVPTNEIGNETLKIVIMVVPINNLRYKYMAQTEWFILLKCIGIVQIVQAMIIQVPAEQGR